MKVLFQCEQLNYRGTTNSILDYAHYNQQILGNESVIVYSAKDPAGVDTGSAPEVIETFKNKFQVLTYDSHEHLNDIASKFDFCYSQRAGLKHNMNSSEMLPIINTTKFGVHSVFQWYDPHGDVYSYISEWLSDTIKEYYKLESPPPFVPYIVDLPKPNYDVRAHLGIPKDALVIGRHGGFNTFDIEFVHKTVKRVAEERKDIVFLFANTARFCDQPNVLFLQPFFGQQQKSNFINACDAMLHGRTLGESFGLSIAESLFFNKPVLSWSGGFDRNHVKMLNQFDLLYGDDESDVYSKILGLRDRAPRDYKSIVEPFSPKNVMEKFRETFLDPLPTLGNP